MHRLYELGTEDVFRAHGLGLVPDDALYFLLLAEERAKDRMPAVSSDIQGGRLFEKYPRAKAVTARAIDRIVSIEETRGELPCATSPLASRIRGFEGGVRHFTGILTALGEAGLTCDPHNHVLDARRQETKNDSLCRLLLCCRPVAGEPPSTLKAALEEAQVSEGRAIEAALFAPQWAGALEEALGIEGLRSGVWFFRAHVCEPNAEGKESEVARYSPIPLSDLSEGAFDKEWFFEAYQALGEKRFGQLYRNAKLIAGSSSRHRRIQLYVDAVLGRLQADAVKAEVVEKRNQDKLGAYALIPLDEGRQQDALERYEFICLFLKESRQWGQQRRASEARACEVALANLAITTGYHDVDRMVWALEGMRMESLRHLMAPRALGEAEVWLSFEGDGTPQLKVSQKGVVLKTLPKELAKHESVIEIKEAVKQLGEQRRRARQSFEAAMVSRSSFSVSEVASLLAHPALGPLVAPLVFGVAQPLGQPNGQPLGQPNGQPLGQPLAQPSAQPKGQPLGQPSALPDGQPLAQPNGQPGGRPGIPPAHPQALRQLGFPRLFDGSLVLTDADGSSHRPAKDEWLSIAHPYDLITWGVWSAFQRRIYHEKIVQPFKQVFREYYPLTEDELNMGGSTRRYAGHQVAPKKALALLQSRGWTVGHEVGLQRVWHKENVVVCLYVQADWFSPSDIEAPTLEGVEFSQRRGSTRLLLAEIPPVVFSETMRDIDLMVSVAHVGGVDPEASHSTVEMRTAIAKELLSALGIHNISFQKAHAHIMGALGEYSVHMGSGIVHKAGTGMLAVLPVPSQARGRIFLPFADDDPKTAEVISKLLLFADDKKIKDPSILRQMNA
ncbi:MAG: DUF5724 domain-containing protein [Coriobacteriaceae bacterium]|nr:DUF5724 domain-containing protein [Coriobacteriaceae bacterium]